MKNRPCKLAYGGLFFINSHGEKHTMSKQLMLFKKSLEEAVLRMGAMNSYIKIKTTIANKNTNVYLVPVDTDLLQLRRIKCGRLH